MADITTQLRPYQHKAIELLRSAFKSGKRRVVLAQATGSGKTVQALALAHAAAERGKRVAFVASRIQIVQQTSSVFYEGGLSHGVVQAGNSRNTHSPVLICSVQTLRRRGMLEGLDLLILDECHGAVSETYRKLIFAAKNAFIVGLSASPWAKGMARHHGELGGPLFDGLVQAITVPQLIEQGYLVDCEVWCPDEPDMTGVRIVKGDYDEVEMEKRVNQPKLTANIVEQWLKHARGKPTCVFASSIAHSKKIVDDFTKAGVAAEHLDAYTPDEYRRSTLIRLAEGETKVVSCVALLAEGFDAPHCEVVVFARPTKSLIRFVQIIGRALRPYPGKTMAMILDHSGNCKRFPYPTSDLPMVLDSGKHRDSEADKIVKEAKLPKVCPKCSFLKPAGVHVCPQCGFKPERQDHTVVAKGQLVKLEKRTKPKADTWAELLYLGEKRNYSSGRLSNLFREYHGVWPHGLKHAGIKPVPPTKEIIDFVTSRNIAYARSPNKPKPAPDAGWQQEALEA